MSKKIRIKSSADIIKEKVRNNSEVIDYVNDILDIIQNAIEDSIEREQKYCIVRVSSSFSVTFLSHVRAKRDIYYLAHQALVQAGYIVNIKYKGENLYKSTETYFEIKWESNYDQEVNTHKDEYLNKVSEKVISNIEKNKPKKYNKNKQR